MTMTERTEEYRELILERIEQALQIEAWDEAVSLFQHLHPADRAEVFYELDKEDQQRLIQHLTPTALAELLEWLDEEDAVAIAREMGVAQLADVLDEMDPDEAADLLGDLRPERARQALAEMEEAAEVRPLLGYPDDTAGGRMTTAYIALPRQTTAAEAIAFLRQVDPTTDVPYYLYVVDPEGRLVGVVGLRELVTAAPEMPLEQIMDPEVIFVTADTDQEEAAQIMSRYDLSAVPVVDHQRRLLGVITFDDLVQVLEEEATEDIYRLANVSDEDLDPESPLKEQIKGRLPWLYLNTVTALFAAWVIGHFEHIIAQAAVLAMFQSVVAGQGGNTASQNVAMTVRSLALGKISPRNLLRILAKQFTTGLALGLLVGSVVGLGVYLWRGNLYLSLVLGLALVGNLSLGAVVGVLVPLGLKAIGIDPALASSILVTAVTDAAGFFIFLSLAAHFLAFIK